MYTHINFKTKKELKAAVDAYNKYMAEGKFDGAAGKRVTIYQPNGDITGVTAPLNGTVYLEGPHYPKPHMWYAEAVVKDGAVIKVK